MEVSVGVGVFVRRIFHKWDDDFNHLHVIPKILIGERIGKVANGILALPGGHMEYGESFKKTALRELEEECGKKLEVYYKPIRKPNGELCVTNNFMPHYEKHNVTIWLICDYKSGEAELMEPNKCKGWTWKTLKEIQDIPYSEAQDEWLPKWMFREFDNYLKLECNWWDIMKDNNHYFVLKNGTTRFCNKNKEECVKYIESMYKYEN